jgi:hypothetical protein
MSPRKNLFEPNEWGEHVRGSALDLLRGVRRRELPEPTTPPQVPPTVQAMHIARKRLKASKVIGAGQFGKVYRAAHKVDSATIVVRAVKVLVGKPTKAKDTEFLREAAVLAELDHPTITKLIGVNVEKRPWLAVLE